MGICEGSNSKILGSVGSLGKSLFVLAWSTASFTFPNASSTGILKSNFTLMVVYPWTEFELISSTSLIPPISFSIAVEIFSDMYFGEDPGFAIPIYISGIFSSGKFSFGMVWYAPKPPIIMTTAIKKTVLAFFTAKVVNPNPFELLISQYYFILTTSFLVIPLAPLSIIIIPSCKESLLLIKASPL